MESSNSPNRDTAEDVQSDVNQSVDTCIDENATKITVAEAVSSCSNADDTTSAAAECTVSLDPYSYVQRGDYTSEVYKLELMNLPKRFGIAVSIHILIISTRWPKKQQPALIALWYSTCSRQQWTEFNSQSGWLNCH